MVGIEIELLTCNIAIAACKNISILLALCSVTATVSVQCTACFSLLCRVQIVDAIENDFQFVGV